MKVARLPSIPVILVCLLVSCSASSEPDFDRGMQAYEREDYAAALREWRPLAKQGHVEAQYWLGAMYADEYVDVLPQDYAKATHWYGLAAEQGHSLAQVDLGYLYETGGHGIQHDFTEAVRWYRLAAEQGNYFLGQKSLGWMYAKGQGVPQDWVLAHQWFDLAAAQEDWPDAKFAAIDRDYVTSRMTPIRIDEAPKLPPEVAERQLNRGFEAYNRGDYAEAYHDLRPLAEQGHAGAQNLLAYIYGSGDGVQQDFAESFRWRRAAAEGGNVDAQYMLGNLYAATLHGFQDRLRLPRLGRPDDVQGYKWMHLAAEGDHIMARFSRHELASRMTSAQIVEAENLARARLEAKGLPVPPGNAAQRFEIGMQAYQAYQDGDYAEALRGWRLLAEKGDSSAQRNLAAMYLRGLGVPQDHAAAARWYRWAAVGGDASARASLGTLYSTGRGVPQDHAAAAHWYELAAEQGNALGQAMLGMAHANGLGVPKDDVLAYKWLNLSKSQGFEQAVEHVDTVAARMTSEQIADAQKLAREWAAGRAERETAPQRGREDAQRDAYIAAVQSTVERRWRVPNISRASDEAMVLVQINPDTGRILSYDVERCSGSAAFCDSVRQTMDRLQSLPRPPDAETVRGGIRIRFSPPR